ncbi:MAG: hypothetical protein ACR2P1_03940 [Pseudomonadales bacterium]
MPLPFVPAERTKRLIFKRVLYPLLSLIDVFTIIVGKAQPRVPFLVKGDPPTTYYNFRIKPDQLEAFRVYINLPEHLPLTPIKCLTDESEDYLLTLNVYHVGGILTGVRAEWSTYVTDHLGIRRYMVLEARSSKISFDAASFITRATLVEHDNQNDILTSVVESEEQKIFRIDSDLSSLEQCHYLTVAGEWIEANDYIYWRNGICDRTFYEAGMANSRVKNVPNESITIDDQTHWAPFIETKPKHTLVFEAPMEFILVPWRNLETIES